MGVDQNIVAGVLLEMTLRPPLRFLALFRVFICVPLHWLKYVFKNWLPQKVAQLKVVFTDPVITLCNADFFSLRKQNLVIRSSKYQKLKILRSSAVSAAISLPYVYHTSWKFDSRKASFWLRRTISGIKFPMCLHLPFTSLLPYLLKFDSRKASFWLKRAVLGIKFPMCLHISFYHTSWNLIPVKLLSRLERAVLGIKFSLCIHSPSTTPLEIWFP